MESHKGWEKLEFLERYLFEGENRDKSRWGLKKEGGGNSNRFIERKKREVAERGCGYRLK